MAVMQEKPYVSWGNQHRLRKLLKFRRLLRLKTKKNQEVILVLKLRKSLNAKNILFFV